MLVPLIMMGAQAALQAYSAKKSSDAAKKAAAQQTASAQQALDLQKAIYQQTRTDFAPYREQGTQGLTALSQLLGLPAAPPGASTPPAVAPTTGPPRAPGAGTPLWLRGASGYPVPGAPAGQSAYGGGTVLLRAPNGQTKAVPADQVDYYLARGATRG